MLRFWESFTPKMKRILAIIAFFLLAIIITIAGVLTPLSAEDADALSKGLNQTRETVHSLESVQQVSFIFGNNFMMCLAGFVPIAGPAFECYVLYSTGVVIAADSYNQANPLLVFFLLFLFPFTWLEFLAYSVAMAESFWLTWRLIQHRGRSEIRNTCMFIALCAVLLLVGAVIEVAFISLSGS